MSKQQVTVNPLKDVSFAQDSIKNTFMMGKLRNKLLGNVLDDIIGGNKDYLNYILSHMEEAKYKNSTKYYARNNRSLWLLKQLVLNNYDDEFNIWRSTRDIETARFTTKNDGTKIMIRGNPGGKNTKPAAFWDVANDIFTMAFNERVGYMDDSDDEYEEDEDD